MKKQKTILEYVQEARTLKNEALYPKYDAATILKASSMLKAIATNSKVITMQESAILLKASIILAEKQQQFIAGESAQRLLESVTDKGIKYMTDKLPKNMNANDFLRKHAPISTDEQLKAAVDKELANIEKDVDQRMQKVVNFLKKAAKIAKVKFELKDYDKKIGRVDAYVGSKVFYTAVSTPWATSQMNITTDAKGNIKSISDISGLPYFTPENLADFLKNKV